MREAVWFDERDLVVRYNLAFLLPHLLGADNGRVLGFDNAHGNGRREEGFLHKLRGDNETLLQGSSRTQESL